MLFSNTGKNSHKRMPPMRFHVANKSTFRARGISAPFRVLSREEDYDIMAIRDTCDIRPISSFGVIPPSLYHISNSPYACKSYQRTMRALSSKIK